MCLLQRRRLVAQGETCFFLFSETYLSHVNSSIEPIKIETNQRKYTLLKIDKTTPLSAVLEGWKKASLIDGECMQSFAGSS